MDLLTIVEYVKKQKEPIQMGGSVNREMEVGTLVPKDEVLRRQGHPTVFFASNPDHYIWTDQSREDHLDHTDPDSQRCAAARCARDSLVL